MSESEMFAEPDWLAAEPSASAKLAAIMAAVRRCYAECTEPQLTPPTGPHLTTMMAELFIGQLLMRAQDDAPIVSVATPLDLTDEALAAVNRLHTIVHPSIHGGVYEPERNPGGCDNVFCCAILPEVPATVEPAIRADERERVRPLVDQWRRAADSLRESNAAWSSHFHDCANELERLLEES